MISKFIGVAIQLCKNVSEYKIWCIFVFRGIHGITLHMMGEKKTGKKDKSPSAGNR
ncbi:MAG: hypothetical protein H0Z25_10040 [Kosmotoga sp.]|uniref:hypothetical protein n=1 Tax=Kosmotoga sp. TaxID=1955248 RepID=UPI001D739642|nr:hypothetical protein [Kosmotoga sp.]MBO8167529.1 hypothetical protein [Kosmotoga sp.]